MTTTTTFTMPNTFASVAFEPSPLIGDLFYWKGKSFTVDEYVFLGWIEFTWRVYTYRFKIGEDGKAISKVDTELRVAKPVQAWGNVKELGEMVALEGDAKTSMIVYRDGTPYGLEDKPHGNVKGVSYIEEFMKICEPQLTDARGIYNTGDEATYNSTFKPISFRVVPDPFLTANEKALV